MLRCPNRNTNCVRFWQSQLLDGRGIWRSMTRMKLQLTRDRLRLQNQIECLLEEMRIKLSIVISNLANSRE